MVSVRLRWRRHVKVQQPGAAVSRARGVAEQLSCLHGLSDGDRATVVAQVQIETDGAVAMPYPDVVAARGSWFVAHVAWNNTGANHDSIARSKHFRADGHSEVDREALRPVWCRG